MGRAREGAAALVEYGSDRDGSIGGAGMRLGVRDPAAVKPWTVSFLLELRREPVVKMACREEVEQSCPEVWVAPLWTTAGRMIGAVVVCGAKPDTKVAEALSPIEMLAAKLARGHGECCAGGEAAAVGEAGPGWGSWAGGGGRMR